MPWLTEIQSAQIVAPLETGLNQSAVTTRMDINRSTVSHVFNLTRDTSKFNQSMH